jgi:hypothetical protein
MLFLPPHNKISHSFTITFHFIYVSATNFCPPLSLSHIFSFSHQATIWAHRPIPKDGDISYLEQGTGHGEFILLGAEDTECRLPSKQILGECLLQIDQSRSSRITTPS